MEPRVKAVSKEVIIEALTEVMDPEIPSLSVIDLGMIGDVVIANDSIKISLIPTFTACPALRVLQSAIHDRVKEFGFDEVQVIKDTSVIWDTNRITAEGKKKLEQFGLGTPQKHDGKFSMQEILHAACPHCGSKDTTMNSLFGSTLCRSMHYCFDCRQGFERFKPL
jgi:ring-1,2-phenylacetyl-CoA epoxidase subunit PaaD